jgi:fused signal recognition particle receptor
LPTEVAAPLKPEAMTLAPAAADAASTNDEGGSKDEGASKRGWFARLKGGLAKTRNQLADLFGVVKVDEQMLEDLESALIQADAGIAATESLISALRQAIKQEKLHDGQAVRYRLRDLIRDRLIPLEGGIDLDRSTPLVLMIAGVNGAGKTTSIGKLARHVQREGKSVLLAAGDTFRAAAREQLAIWGERNGVEVIAQQGGDPAAVAFDAVSAGRARQSGVVMIDTAGRLPTQSHLMDELKKIRRVIGKAMSDAPHEALLILDGNTGQNMLHQVKAFDEAISLSGLVVTKLDGTAKGGALLALAHQLKDRPIPVYFIGVGEGVDDLQAFRAEEFANALLDC